MTGRVLHAGPAIVDVSMRVPSVPVAGGDVYAQDSRITAGGGFNVMAAAARDGAEVVYLGMRGDGAFSLIVDAALRTEGVTLGSQVVPGVDVGYCISMVDDAGERTFVSVLGAEGLDNSASLRSVTPTPDDVVYATGYTLLNDASRGALLAWLHELPAHTRVVLDPSPLVADVPVDALEVLRHRVDVWTLSTSEAHDLRERVDPPESMGHVDADVTWLAGWADGAVVLRRGAAGCQVATPGPEPVVDIAATPVEVVDTTGAGDTHAGVLMARLVAGESLVDAARRATVAAGISVTRRGPATSPTAAEVDAALARLG